MSTQAQNSVWAGDGGAPEITDDQINEPRGDTNLVSVSPDDLSRIIGQQNLRLAMSRRGGYLPRDSTSSMAAVFAEGERLWFGTATYLDDSAAPVSIVGSPQLFWRQEGSAAVNNQTQAQFLTGSLAPADTSGVYTRAAVAINNRSLGPMTAGFDTGTTGAIPRDFIGLWVQTGGQAAIGRVDAINPSNNVLSPNWTYEDGDIVIIELFMGQTGCQCIARDGGTITGSVGSEAINCTWGEVLGTVFVPIADYPTFSRWRFFHRNQAGTAPIAMWNAGAVWSASLSDHPMVR